MESMTPAPAGPPPLMEQDYWRDYEIIKNDVHAAMVSCYTHRTINHIPATDQDVLEKINRQPEFWQVTSFSLQNTLFIVLARILDSDPDVHSIHHVLNATIAHPEFFSHAALRARKLSIQGTPPNPPWLDEYVGNAWEPTTKDLRVLKNALVPHKAKFDQIYKPIRNQIAHIIFKDDARVADLYSRTLKTEIDDILRFLHCLVKSIWYLAYNAEPPNLNGDHYGYGESVAQITRDTEHMLRSLP
jgi:AbiU2